MDLRLRVVRQTYRSDIDDTLQPYMVFVPRGYRSLAPLPVVFVLHGFGGTEESALADRVIELCVRHQFLAVAPRGRGNTFYDGVGERDFWDVLADVFHKYPVNEDRIYLLGASMGGTGVYRLATRFPDRFAAAIAICGWTDYHYWYRHWYASGKRPNHIPSWRKPLLERASPVYMAENLMHVPLFIMHGARDGVVEVEEARRMVNRLHELGYEVVYKEYARSSHSNFTGRLRSAFAWLEGKSVRDWLGKASIGSVGASTSSSRACHSSILTHHSSSFKQRSRAPAQVVLVTNCYRYNTAYWVRIDRFQQYLRFARIQAHLTMPDRIEVRVCGVEQFTLLLERVGLSQQDSIHIHIGRQCAYEGRGLPEISFIRTACGWRIVEPSFSPSLVSSLSPLPGRERVGVRVKMSKTSGLEGPLEDAFTSRFLLVYGADERDAAEAHRFSSHWNRWMIPADENGEPRGSCLIKSALEVTPEDIAQSHLILFGRPRSNRWVGEIASALPIRIRQRGINVGGERFDGEQFGLRMIYPNPLNPSRYVVVWIGSMPQRVKDMECLPWLFPDYVVFDSTRTCSRTVHPYWDAFDARSQSGEIKPDDVPDDDKPQLYLPECFVRAGFFDGQWEL